MRLSMCSERDRELEHDGRARPASRERQPAKPAKKKKRDWAHLITLMRRRICRLLGDDRTDRRRISGDVEAQVLKLCGILCKDLGQNGRLLVRIVAALERAESFGCAVEQAVDFASSIPHQLFDVVRVEVICVKAEHLDKVDFLRCDGRSRLRLRHPPVNQIEANSRF